MRTLGHYLISLILLLNFSSALAFVSSFYTLRQNESNAIQQQHQQINLIIAQAYFTSAKNKIIGSINLPTVKTANKYHIKVLAQVTNYGFDTTKVQEFLGSNTLQTQAISTLLKKCKTLKLAGVQIDFEHLNINDKTAFTAFIKKLSLAFHQAHLIVSVTIMPSLYQNPPTPLLKLEKKDWTGAYDAKQLAKYCNFITIMAYDQHTANTTPGPVAGFAWVKAIVKHYSKLVPSNKLSLGIPTYSMHWKMRQVGNEIVPLGNQITYSQVEQLIKQYKLRLAWDPKNKINYAIFAPYFTDQYLYIENARSFASTLVLAKKSHLRGISVFRMGDGDPKIWKLLTPNPGYFKKYATYFFSKMLA